MDLLRGGAVLLIVVVHSLTVPGGFIADYEPDGPLLDINNALSPYRVPLLFFLSGMLVPRGARKGPGRFATGKLSRVLWPLVVWQVIFAVILGTVHSLTSLPDWTSGMLWFLAALVVCYAIAWVRILLLPLVDVPWAALAALLFAWFMVGFAPFEEYERILWGCLIFFVGAAVSNVVGVIQERMSPILVGALAVVASVGTYQVVADGLFFRFQEVLPTTICGILVLLWVAPRITGNRLSDVIEWYGRQSVVVYVAHPAAMYVVLQVIVFSGVDIGVLLPVITLAAGLLLPTILIALLPRGEWLFAFPLERVAKAARPGGRLEGGA